MRKIVRVEDIQLVMKLLIGWRGPPCESWDYNEWIYFCFHFRLLKMHHRRPLSLPWDRCQSNTFLRYRLQHTLNTRSAFRASDILIWPLWDVIHEVHTDFFMHYNLFLFSTSWASVSCPCRWRIISARCPLETWRHYCASVCSMLVSLLS